MIYNFDMQIASHTRTDLRDWRMKEMRTTGTIFGVGDSGLQVELLWSNLGIGIIYFVRKGFL